MTIADVPGAAKRVVMQGTTRITPKYSVEITLYDFHGVLGLEFLWAPHLPSPAKLKALSARTDLAAAPYYAKMLQMTGLFEGGKA